MRVNFQRRFSFSLITITFAVGFIFISQAKGQEQPEESQIVTKKTSDGTRIEISTSGPAEFICYWLDEPPRLVVEFKSRNIVSKIDKEVIVNQGVIKRVTSSYFGRGRRRTLKSLTFELTQKVPYKIWQENDTILLDIQAPLETPVFLAGTEQVVAGTEVGGAIIERLEAMDAALMRLAESEPPLKIPEAPLEIPEAKVIEVDRETVEEIKKAEEEVVLPKPIVLPATEPAKERKPIVNMVFWLAGLILISGSGLLLWRRHKLSVDEKLKRLKLELQEKSKRLQQEEFIRKAMEEASLKKEKEYQQVKNSFESLKGELVEKGLVKRELYPEEKERPWIPGKSQERRQYHRLPLSQDYNRTIILRIETQGKPKKLKSFANNISFDGLCFETKEEFQKKEPVNLRLFFYGDIVPMMRIQASIVWKKETAPLNYYGVYFDLVEEKDKSELSRYIESKIGRG